MSAVYREHAGADWIEVEILSRHPGGFVCREVGRLWPGVWVADWSQVRETTDAVIEPRNPAGPALETPVRRMSIVQRRIYRKLRTAGIAQGEAYRVALS